MILLDSDRRLHERTQIERPCKVFDPRSHKYLLGSTCDLSVSGMMMKLEHPLQIMPGETLHVGVAQKRRQMLLRASEMTPMRVVRCLHSPEGGTCLGLELIQPLQIEAQPIRRAA